MQQPSFMRFNELPEGYRRGIIAAGIGLLFIAAVAFAISYSALYAYARDSGLYSSRIARLYPLMLDLPVILGMGVSVVLAAIKGNRFWPWAIVAGCGFLTVWFNIQHAGSDPGHRLLAAVPPVLVVMCIEAFLALIHSVRKQLGALNPLPYPTGPYGATTVEFGAPQGHGQAWGSPQLPAASHKATVNPQNGQSGLQLDGGNRTPAGDLLNKRRMVQEYLEGLPPDEIQTTTAREITAMFTEAGVKISEATVAQVLRRVRQASEANSNGKAGSNGKRGRGAKS